MSEATSLASRLAHDSGGRLFGVFWGSLTTVDLTAVLRLPRLAGIAGVLAVVAVGSARQAVPTLLAAAGTGWLFVNGFLVHHLGRLGWDGLPDLGLLVLLVATAWAGSRARVPGWVGHRSGKSGGVKPGGVNSSRVKRGGVSHVAGR